jgi:hypothetical protein
MTIIVLALRRRLRLTLGVFFRYVDLKKKRVGYPSVMTFESQSGSQKICDLFARFIERTYADKPWVPSDGCQVDSIYTDFSKAFSKVRHRWLLDIMSTDVEPSRCQWLGSYNSGRIQRVKIGECVSRDILVTSGVSQTAIWGHSVSFGL